MKEGFVPFWYWITHLWYYEQTEEKVILVTPLFEFRMGWDKPLHLDILQETIEIYFCPNPPFEWYASYEEIFKFKLKKVYQEVERKYVFLHKYFPWHYFQKKYLRNIKGNICLMVTNE